jgi:anti-sigma B factor antagonist
LSSESESDQLYRSDDLMAGNESLEATNASIAAGTQTGPPTPGQLQIQQTGDHRETVLALDGELDLATAPELERRLRAAGLSSSGRLVIDLRRLRFMDSTGISLLIEAQQAASAGGWSLALRRGPAQVQRVLELTGILERFDFED